MPSFDWNRFREVPIVAILRGIAIDRLPALLQALRDGGLNTLEITMNSPDASRQIALAVRLSEGQLNIGAGTVTTTEALAEALDAGAGFIVTPAIRSDVIAACRRRGVPIFPGACTPSEVLQAWEQGANMVKVFPADALGPGYIARLKSVMPEIPLLPTGGVDLSTIAEFRKAGADGFGIGSPLFNPAAIEAGNWDVIRTRSVEFRERLRI